MNIALIVLIAANVLISFKAFEDQFFFRRYEFHIGSIRAGEHIRMFSSAFLHVDIAHLAFNMITLYFFAPVVSSYLGIPSFLVVYLGSLLCGSLLTLQFHKNEYNMRKSTKPLRNLQGFCKKLQKIIQLIKCQKC